MSNSNTKKFPWHLYPSVHDVMENTKFKTYEMATAAIQTLAWLEDGAPHKFDGLPGVFRFDMTRFVETDSCNTSCCIAGAMASYIKNKEGDLDCFKGFSWRTPNIEDIFDVEMGDGSDLDKLFYPMDKTGCDVRKVSAPVAARTLRRYMNTGKVSYRA